MTNHDLTHKIEEAIRNIFLKNEGQPLSIQEVILKVEEELGNGEINAELTGQIIEKMRDGFALLETPDGRLTLSN